MADNKRDQERAALHRMIWGMANDLRGSVIIKRIIFQLPLKKHQLLWG